MAPNPVPNRRRIRCQIGVGIGAEIGVEIGAEFGVEFGAESEMSAFPMTRAQTARASIILRQAEIK